MSPLSSRHMTLSHGRVGRGSSAVPEPALLQSSGHSPPPLGALPCWREQCWLPQEDRSVVYMHTHSQCVKSHFTVLHRGWVDFGAALLNRYMYTYMCMYMYMFTVRHMYMYMYMYGTCTCTCTCMVHVHVHVYCTLHASMRHTFHVHVHV